MDGAMDVAQPPASSIKHIPDQNVLANGQKSPLRRGRVTLTSTKASSPPSPTLSSSPSPPLSPRSSPKSSPKSSSKPSSSPSSPTFPRTHPFPPSHLASLSSDSLPAPVPQSRGRIRSQTLSLSASHIKVENPPSSPNNCMHERRGGRFASRERSNSEPVQPWLTIDGIWDDAEANWQEVCNQKGRLITLLYKKGIPAHRRINLWARISQLIPETELIKCSQEEVEGPTHRCIYKRLLELNNTQHEQQIRADITRTFPSEESIYAPEFQKSLFNVLKAFSLYDEEVGYCQGLNFVAALLLMHTPEEKAFFMLIRLLKGHKLRSFYTVDMRGVRLRMHQMNKLTQTLFPRLSAHMDDLGVSAAVVTTPWFMTAFGYQLPVDVALRVMDTLLYEGIPALFRIALAILVLCEEEIMALNVDGVMDYFRSDLRAKFQDPQQLMNTAYAVNVSMTQLEAFELEFLQAEAAVTRVESEFSKNSEEEEIANRNTLMYSQVLIDSHELKEKLHRKSTDYNELAKEFEMYKKKVETEKVALVQRLGESLDKVSSIEAENEFLTAMLSRTEKDLRQIKQACNQLSDCNVILSEELYKHKKKDGGEITVQIRA